MSSVNFRNYHLATQNQYGLRSAIAQHKSHYSDTSQDLQNPSAWPLPDGTRIRLPDVVTKPHAQTRKYLRSSNRNWIGTSISSQELSEVLMKTVGFQDIRLLKRYVARAGNLESIRVHIAVLAQGDFSTGLYTYDPSTHSVILREKGDFRDWVRKHVFFQDEFGDAASVLFIESNFSLIEKKYGNRAYRLALMDVGHVSHAIYSHCTATGINVCASAGFYETEVERVLSIQSQVSSVFLAVGLGKVQ